VRRAGAVVVTLGERGSKILTPDREISIPAAEPRTVEDPTGAGDAYRGGLISGLVRGRDLELCAWLGSVCASFAVESYGTRNTDSLPRNSRVGSTIATESPGDSRRFHDAFI